jgi:hypothetical protein
LKPLVGPEGLELALDFRGFSGGKEDRFLITVLRDLFERFEIEAGYLSPLVTAVKGVVGEEKCGGI